MGVRHLFLKIIFPQDVQTVLKGTVMFLHRKLTSNKRKMMKSYILRPIKDKEKGESPQNLQRKHQRILF